MGSPLHTSVRQSGTGLVSAYIQYIGTREPNNINALRNGRPDNPFQASLAVGASCLLLINGIDREADIALGKVRDTMATYVTERGRLSALGPAAAHLQLIAGMLLSRDDPDAARRFQDASHAETITDLKNLRPRCRRGDSVAGSIAEQALTSLVTRYAGPGTLAVQALLHHDQGKRQVDNTDILVIDRGTSSSEATAHRGQIKSRCLLFCEDGAESNTVGRIRAAYMEDIVLISGHCDVLDPDSGHSMNGLAKRLELEARGAASSQQAEVLDEATLHLLQTIVDPEEWRMGTGPMARSVEYTYAA